MKGKLCIVVDTGADLLGKYPESYPDVKRVQLRYIFGGKSYKEEIDDIGEGIRSEDVMPNEEFDRRIKTEFPGTSGPSVGDYLKLFESLVGEYDYVLVLPISDGMSSSYGSAVSAAEEFRSNLKSDAKIVIRVVDTHTISLALGFLVDDLMDTIMENPDIEFSELVKISEEFYKRTNLYVAIEDIENLHRGGRVSGLQGLIAGILRLKVIVHIEDKFDEIKGTIVGKIEKHQVRRTTSQALRYMVEKVEEAAKLSGIKKVAVAYTGTLEQAKDFAKDIVSTLLSNGKKLSLEDIPMKIPSKAIQVHAGKNAFGVCFMT